MVRETSEVYTKRQGLAGEEPEFTFGDINLRTIADFEKNKMEKLIV